MWRDQLIDDLTAAIRPGFGLLIGAVVAAILTAGLLAAVNVADAPAGTAGWVVAGIIVALKVSNYYRRRKELAALGDDELRAFYMGYKGLNQNAGPDT